VREASAVQDASSELEIKFATPAHANGLEPFDALPRPIAEQAPLSLGLEPLIGVHVPPIPCADQPGPPGFPRPGGPVLG
jgi:hypothetical protein